MKLSVNFMSLSGRFRTLRTESFDSPEAALSAVRTHAESEGFRNVKSIPEDDGYRYTATTPKGQGGRNVAFSMWDFEPND